MLLRPATPADAPFLAWGLDEAAGGLFAAMFGGGRAVLTRVMAQPQHAFSFQHVTVAEVDGRPAGMCQGFGFGTPGGGLALALARAAGVRSVRAGVVALALLPAVTALTRHAQGEWYLQAIAVVPDFRGVGVGTALFADAFDRARATDDSDRLVLDVERDNHRARALYERLGLVVTSTSRRAVLANNVQVQRMAAPLDTTVR